MVNQPENPTKERQEESVHTGTVRPAPGTAMKYTNITSTFSGIGYVILDVNSIVLAALERYSLCKEELPAQTVAAHLFYTVQNLHAASLRDVRLYCEDDPDPWLAAIQAVLRTAIAGATWLAHREVLDYSTLSQTLENDRVALLLACRGRAALARYCFEHGLYVGMLDSLCFELPFAYCNVQHPSEHLAEQAPYEAARPCVPDGARPLEELLRQRGTSIEEMAERFNGAMHSYARLEEPLEEELARAVACRGTVLLDGQILAGKELRLEEDRADAPLVPWKDQPPFPWSGKDLELNMSGEVEHMNPKHLANICRSAMSLYGGRYLNTYAQKEQPEERKMSAKMRKIIEQNKARLRAEQEREDNSWLWNFYQNYEKLSSLQNKRAYLEGVRPQNGYIWNKVMLLKIELYMEMWSLEKRSAAVNEAVLIPLYLSCLEYIERNVGGQGPSDQEMEFVLVQLVEAGFEATAHELVERHALERFDLPFKTDATAAPNDIDLYFQLRYAGEYLKRTLGTRKDPRVPFGPDAWQVELLDAVDAGSSAIVSAPTSSGKTFICFYAIEKVLKSSDTDVVIFCLPTKALVNQVTADIYARFSPKSCATVLQGTLMPDRSSETFNCQVLITVPSMLESLLASACSKNLRYIIIDEVHKINDETLGVPIERVIHMARCPLLLLSATISNLEQFYAWFHAVEAAKGRDCKLVTHGERFCELKMHLFGSTGQDTPYTLFPLNSMFAYSHSHLKTFGFGRDLHFLPEELLNLYYYIYMVLEKGQKKLIRQLAPKNFFKSNMLCKADIREYQRHLLGHLEGWIHSGVLAEGQVSRIYELLVGEAPRAFGLDYTEDFLVRHMLALLDRLKDEKMLPVIVFNTDRDLVTRLARSVYAALESRDQLRKKDRAAERLRKEAKRNRDAEKGRNAWIEESIASEQPAEAEARDIRCTYLDPATRLTDSEVAAEMAEARASHRDVLSMPYRGIGIHHSAMSRKYRSAIEILFRKKHVRVLFATDTLALGVNMPCRTVVFAGDSLKLDPMNYRQMAGRAGRRGYDTLGHVVFMGISSQRIQNLMVSQMPEIRGGYLMSNVSCISFPLQDAIIHRPLQGFSRAVAAAASSLCASATTSLCASATTSLCASATTSLCISAPSTNAASYTFNAIDTEDSRKELLDCQKASLPFIFSQNYLWDLIIANRSADPGIIVFSLLVANDCLSWKEDELFLVIAHLFEVRPFCCDASVALKALPEKCCRLVEEINRKYLHDLSRFYSPQLRVLAARSDRPMHYVKSFIYFVDAPKNSYIYDFAQHGSPVKIMNRNKVTVGELWQSLNNINRLLVSLVRVMERCYGPKDSRVNKLKDTFTKFNKKYKDIFA